MSAGIVIYQQPTPDCPKIQSLVLSIHLSPTVVYALLHARDTSKTNRLQQLAVDQGPDLERLPISSSIKRLARDLAHARSGPQRLGLVRDRYVDPLKPLRTYANMADDMHRWRLSSWRRNMGLCKLVYKLLVVSVFGSGHVPFPRVRTGGSKVGPGVMGSVW